MWVRSAPRGSLSLTVSVPPPNRRGVLKISTTSACSTLTQSEVVEAGHAGAFLYAFAACASEAVGTRKSQAANASPAAGRTTQRMSAVKHDRVNSAQCRRAKLGLLDARDLLPGGDPLRAGRVRVEQGAEETAARLG